jgi:hypothetical protein
MGKRYRHSANEDGDFLLYDIDPEWLRDEAAASAPSSVGDGGAPDLQKLIAQYGGYSLIPPQAWADFDEKMLFVRQQLWRHHAATGNGKGWQSSWKRRGLA